MKHYSVEAPHFSITVTTGGRAHLEQIVAVPPILRWAKGKPWDEFRAYAARNGWTIERLFKERAPKTVRPAPEERAGRS